MLEYFYLILACIISIELFIRFQVFSNITELLTIYRKLFHIIAKSKSSSHWKEKIVPAYSFILLKKSFYIFSIFTMIVLFVFFLVLISDSLSELIFSSKGIILSIVFTMVYLKLKKIINE